MKIKKAIAQAAVLMIAGAAAGLVNNAFSVNGIDPFRSIADIPVYVEAGQDTAGTAAEEREGICYVTLDEFQEMLDAGNAVIDARTSDEYRAGHVPGAILLDYFEMGYYLDSVLPRLDPNRKIGVYCTGPACDDSEMLARELYSMGYKKLCVFRGGMEEWNEAGKPVAHGPEEGWE